MHDRALAANAAERINPLELAEYERLQERADAHADGLHEALRRCTVIGSPGVSFIRFQGSVEEDLRGFERPTCKPWCCVTLLVAGFADDMDTDGIAAALERAAQMVRESA